MTHYDAPEPKPSPATFSEEYLSDRIPETTPEQARAARITAAESALAYAWPPGDLRDVLEMLGLER